MEQVNPGFIETMSMNMNRLGEVYGIYKRSVDLARSDLFEEEAGRITIDITQLKTLSPRRTWLFELFSVHRLPKNPTNAQDV